MGGSNVEITPESLLASGPDKPLGARADVFGESLGDIDLWGEDSKVSEFNVEFGSGKNFGDDFTVSTISTGYSNSNSNSYCISTHSRSTQASGSTISTKGSLLSSLTNGSASSFSGSTKSSVIEDLCKGSNHESNSKKHREESAKPRRSVRRTRSDKSSDICRHGASPAKQLQREEDIKWDPNIAGVASTATPSTADDDTTNASITTDTTALKGSISTDSLLSAKSDKRPSSRRRPGRSNSKKDLHVPARPFSIKDLKEEEHSRCSSSSKNKKERIPDHARAVAPPPSIPSSCATPPKPRSHKASSSLSSSSHGSVSRSSSFRKKQQHSAASTTDDPARKKSVRSLFQEEDMPAILKQLPSSQPAASRGDHCIGKDDKNNKNEGENGDGFEVLSKADSSAIAGIGSTSRAPVDRRATLMKSQSLRLSNNCKKQSSLQDNSLAASLMRLRAGNNIAGVASSSVSVNGGSNGNLRGLNRKSAMSSDASCAGSIKSCRPSLGGRSTSATSFKMSIKTPTLSSSTSSANATFPVMSDNDDVPKPSSSSSISSLPSRKSASNLARSASLGSPGHRKPRRRAQSVSSNSDKTQTTSIVGAGLPPPARPRRPPSRSRSTPSKTDGAASVTSTVNSNNAVANEKENLKIPGNEESGKRI